MMNDNPKYGRWRYDKKVRRCRFIVPKTFSMNNEQHRCYFTAQPKKLCCKRHQDIYERTESLIGIAPLVTNQQWINRIKSLESTLQQLRDFIKSDLKDLNNPSYSQKLALDSMLTMIRRALYP